MEREFTCHTYTSPISSPWFNGVSVDPSLWAAAFPDGLWLQEWSLALSALAIMMLTPAARASC